MALRRGNVEAENLLRHSDGRAVNGLKDTERKHSDSDSQIVADHACVVRDELADKQLIGFR